MFSIKYLFWRWCGAPGFFTPVVSCAPRATKKTLRVEALAPFFLTCWSREIQCDGLCHYGPQKSGAWSEPCRCDPEWCPRTVLTKQQTTFPFVTLLLLKEWFLGPCNMNFVIPPPLSLQHPFTPYPSLQLHPSPEDLPPTLVDPPHNLIKPKRSPRAFRYM